MTIPPTYAYHAPMKRTTLFLPDAQRKFLAKLAKSTGLSVSELVRRAIDAFRESGKAK